jgi:quinol monooxygenase YgiN
VEKNMYIVTVEFEVLPGRMTEFMEAVKAQARISLEEEPLCYRFDVCRPHGEENIVYLYEVYRDAAAFDAHLETRHFASFNTNTSEMINNKSVRTMDKIWKKANE